MKIALITLFPEMFEALTDFGVSGRAVNQGLLEISSFNPRNFAEDVHSTVDDRPYGGGPGMVLMIEPLRRAITAAKEWINGKPLVVYLSPQGKVLQQASVNNKSVHPSCKVLFGLTLVYETKKTANPSYQISVPS